MDEAKVPSIPSIDPNVSFDTLEELQRKRSEKLLELESMKLAIHAHVPPKTQVCDMGPMCTSCGGKLTINCNRDRQRNEPSSGVSLNKHTKICCNCK